MAYKLKLQEIDDLIRQDKTPESVTIRQLLSWFGFQRRTSLQIDLVRSALDDYRLETSPDFNELYYLDSRVTFVRVKWTTKPSRTIRYVEL